MFSRAIQFSILVGVAYSAGLCFAQPISSQAAYPQEWKEFLSDWDGVKKSFWNHVSEAKEISIPFKAKEFDWSINWYEQQKYCKEIANAVFYHPEQIEIPYPDGIVARDGIEKTLDFLDKTFPSCLKKDSEIGDGTYGRAPILSNKKGLEIGVFNKKTAYFSGAEYFIQYDLLKPYKNSDEPIAYWDAYFGIDHGCPRFSVSGPNLSPSAWASLRQTVIVKMNSKLILVEFGTYDGDAPSATESKIYRWGKPGQHFLIVKSLQHQLWGDLAIEAPPSEFSSGAIEDENHTHSSTNAVCVINFDVVKK